MIYSSLGSVSSFMNYQWGGGEGGGGTAPNPSLILQKCVIICIFNADNLNSSLKLGSR